MMSSPEDRNALSWWFPRILAAGLPVPKTEIVPMPSEAKEVAWAMLHEHVREEDAQPLAEFVSEICAAADRFGWPAFLRTDHTSGKHHWAITCSLSSREAAMTRVLNLVEASEVASLIGLPYDAWAVREMLPVDPICYCPDYANMPVVREFRVFAENGVVRCFHPYWPEEALARGGVYLKAKQLAALYQIDIRDLSAVRGLAEAASKACGGGWSVDVLSTRRGWFVTDMAQAADSWHWPGCEHKG